MLLNYMSTKSGEAQSAKLGPQMVLTLEKQVAAFLEKLGFASRHQVGAWMIEHGLPS